MSRQFRCYTSEYAKGDNNMYVGTQFGARHETDIRQLAQLGVKNVDTTPREHWTEWTVELLTSLREKYAKHGINLETIHSPLGSRDAFNNDMSHIFLAPSDERGAGAGRSVRGHTHSVRVGPARPALQHHNSRPPEDRPALRSGRR